MVVTINIRVDKFHKAAVVEMEMKTNGLTQSQRRILGRIYCNSIAGYVNRVEYLAEQLSYDVNYLEVLCKDLVDRGLIVEVNGEYRLTDKGRSSIVVVFTGGVFDIIHPGHIYTLESSKNLGDVLVVSVARDKTVIESKGRSPVNHEKERVKLVNSLKYVDLALLGSEKDIFEIVTQVKPDIITVGYDQKHDERVLIEELRKRGIIVKVVRLTTPMPDIKSSKIKKDVEVMKSF
ncbi:MAG: adenylyltransferase/cytidyltransferase family protein [Nitrososphaerota archaeon]|nr:adenylyltransferase/cytidyltransferase family protein [Nitrososphaerales archaeon]MDW8044377.1 adenylyltransferase/cytidyltransferase family protein [Nitrososphaerota archaeon]